MANKEGQQLDTLPIQMYGWDGTKPVKMGLLNPGLSLPEFDTVEADSTILPTSVVFKSGGSTVATLTITYPNGGIKVVRS